MPGKVNPAVLHIPWVKATFVNVSGAAELSHFRLGAAELRKLEGMQVKKVGGWWGKGGLSEGVGGKNRETAKKMRQKG